MNTIKIYVALILCVLIFIGCGKKIPEGVFAVEKGKLLKLEQATAIVTQTSIQYQKYIAILCQAQAPTAIEQEEISWRVIDVPKEVIYCDSHPSFVINRKDVDPKDIKLAVLKFTEDLNGLEGYRGCA